MTDFIHHTDNVIDRAAAPLPDNWGNISGFCVLGDQGADGLLILKNLGWLPVVGTPPEYDPGSQQLIGPSGVNVGDSVPPNAENVTAIWTVEAIPVTVPVSVSPRQARIALNAAGLRQAVEDWVATQDQNIKDSWEFSLEIRRDDPLILAAAAALSLTEQQLDSLFIAAGSITTTP